MENQRVVTSRLLKLPNKAYRKRKPPPAIRVRTDKTYVAKIHANLGGSDAARARAKTDIQKILLHDIAKFIVNSSRAAHINMTMGNEPTQKVTGWKQLREQGHLNERVAVLVDGSPQRPIKNVQFAGRIDIVGPASLELIVEAARYLYAVLITHSTKYPGPTSGDFVRKGHRMRYNQAFGIFISDTIPVESPAAIKPFQNFEPTDWISIQNNVPYASKLERYRYPHGTFNYGFKKVRAKYGNRLAIRWDYVKSTTSTMRGHKGASIPVAQPVIRIGPPGAFPSRKPNIKRYIRDDANRKAGKRVRRGR